MVRLMRRLSTAFHDLKITDEYVLADGDRAAVEYIMQGTQTGPYTAPNGTVIPPTGKTVRVRGINFLAFDANGLLKEITVIHNENDFVTQLKS